MKNYKHYVVFDGTSSYVIPSEDFDKTEQTILLKTNDLDEASDYSDNFNEEIYNEK